MATVLMSTHGTHGDVLPFLRLGAVLRGRGHRVTLLTHHLYGPSARAEGLDFVPIDTAEQYERNLKLSADLFSTTGTQRWVDFYDKNHIFEQITAECAAIADRHVPGDTVLVTRHTSSVCGLFAAEALQVPHAWVAVAPIQYAMARGAAHLCETTLGAGFAEVRRGLGLPPELDWQEAFRSADLNLALWPGWFDSAGVRSPAGTRLTGFPLSDGGLAEPVPAEVAELLTGPVKPVLVSGGTGRMLHRRFYEVAVEACARTERPALLVVRHRDLVPDRLPEGMLWAPSLPFDAVMPHVAAVVHHGGIGTLARALTAGVPQVILAHGFDRPDNAARLASVDLARWLPAARWSADALAPLLAEALADDGYAARATRAAGPDPLAEAAAAVEELLGADGRARALRNRLRRLPEAQRRELMQRMLSRSARDR